MVLLVKFRAPELYMPPPQYCARFPLIVVFAARYDKRSGIGTVIALINAVRSWATPGRWIWAKLGDALIALSCLGFVWFVVFWSMLHFSLRY